MNKITIAVLLVLTPLTSFAAFKCDRYAVFDNSNACGSYCSNLGISRPCSELEPKTATLSCDTSKYSAFAYVNGKTYALTRQAVTWSQENTAVIRDKEDNEVIASLLRSQGVTSAWIAYHDPIKSSTAYGVTDDTRFKTKNGINPTFTSWRQGEPNNALNSSSIGNSSLYGEYWVVIDQSGSWNDIGLNADGTNKLLPAVVEWNGELSCVSGTEKTTVSDKPTGMVCGIEDDKLGFKFETCSEGNIFEGDKSFLCPIEQTACIQGEEYKKIAVEKIVKDVLPSAYIDGLPVGTTSSGAGDDGNSWTSTIEPMTYLPTITNKGGGVVDYHVQRFQMEYGNIGTVANNHRHKYPDFNRTLNIVSGSMLSATLYLDKVNSNSCDLDYRYVTAFNRVTGKEIPKEQVNRDLCINQGNLNSFVLTDYPIPQGTSFNGFIYSENITFTLKYDVEETTAHTTYTCPQTGRPCIENGGSYSCSPHDCADGSYSGNYEGNQDEVPEGANDPDNNGEIDENGNCLGVIKVFPGNDGRCRTPGTQSKFFQCCKTLKPDEADKPDIIIFPDILDFDICYGTERQLAVNKGKNQCKEIGKYCAEKWKGVGCVQHKITYCCYSDDFVRAYNEAGMDMLGKSWGTPESPNCGGFTVEEMQYLQGAGVADHPKLQEYSERLGKEVSDKLMKEFDKGFDQKSLEGSFQQQIEGLK